MNPEIGRYLEGWHLDTIKLISALYDMAMGQGRDVTAWIDGRELVFTREEPGSDRGFVRLIPSEAHVIVAFPAGDRLFDPRKRLKGPARSQKSLVLGYAGEIDLDVRRLIDAAYAEG